MRIFALLSISFALSFVFQNCDKIEPPYTEGSVRCGSDTLPTPIRKILIEDFTGQKCGNCPRAHEKLQEIKSSYCDYIVPVSIHVGYFAEPSTSGDKFLTDYRTPSGNDYESYFSIEGLPVGMINRTVVNDSRLFLADYWSTVIENILLDPADIKINITNNFIPETRNLSVTVEANILNDLNSNLNLVLCFVEDSIADWQKDYDADPEDIENYIHRHVLRDVINTSWGEQIQSGFIASGNSLSKSYNYIVNSEWNIIHCEIIAYIYDAQTFEIIQAENEPIIPEN